MEDARIRWLCRRGMKELDLMLSRYMDTRWPVADDAERGAFAALLELQDPVLWDVLLERETPPAGTADVVEKIRALSHL